MCKYKVLITTVFIGLAVSLSNAANIIYVDVDSPNDPGTGTSEDPFRRIQAGIDAAGNGDTVQIQPGVYLGFGNYNLDPSGKPITIRSTNPEDAEVVANTVIDPNGNGRGFYIHSGEDANCVISGLTIRNAYTTGLGAGIYCDNSSPSIINCIITGNFAEGYGCGVSCTNSNSQIRHCTISHNRGRYGGGVGCFDASCLTIINCTIVRNSAIFSGGGIFCDMDGHVVINNGIIWANELDYPEYEYGPQVCLFDGSSASISYTDIEGGLEGISSIESTLYWLSGNMNADPCFASFDPNGDPNLWDLHLQSKDGRWNSAFYRIDLNNDGIINLFEFAGLAGVWLQGGNLPEDLDDSGMVDWIDLGLFAQYFLANSYEDGWISDANTSPCVDAGDPNSDWSAEPWPNGKRIDMGAYGGTPQASKSGNIADLNIDGRVNFLDLAELGKLWGTGQETIEDLDNSGTVDIGDLDILATNWLWEKQ